MIHSLYIFVLRFDFLTFRSMLTGLIISLDPTVVCLVILKYRSKRDKNAYTHILYTLPTK